jgi:hypothetical protein
MLLKLNWAMSLMTYLRNKFAGKILLYLRCIDHYLHSRCTSHAIPVAHLAADLHRSRVGSDMT